MEKWKISGGKETKIRKDYFRLLCLNGCHHFFVHFQSIFHFVETSREVFEQWTFFPLTFKTLLKNFNMISQTVSVSAHFTSFIIHQLCLPIIVLKGEDNITSERHVRIPQQNIIFPKCYKFLYSTCHMKNSRVGTRKACEFFKTIDADLVVQSVELIGNSVVDFREFRDVRIRFFALIHRWQRS